MINLLILFCLLFIVACASTTGKKEETNTKKSMTKYTFIDLSKGSYKKHMCQIDTRLASCSGISNIKSCEMVIDKVFPKCEQRILSLMPERLQSRNEFNKYGIELARCLGLNIINETGKYFKEVDSCMRTGFKAF